MKNSRLTLLFILLLTVFCFHAQDVASNQVINATSSRPFAVVELFTSQGCSSCPSADATLSTLTNYARTNNARIYTLSFHVDYWNYIGWKDPFSSVENTHRQRRYAKVHKSKSVYTPQMIINGIQGISGNNHPTLLKKIDEALTQPPRVTFESLSASFNENDQIAVSYELSQKPKTGILNIALVERELSNGVSSGENAGRQLSHDNVVRTFRTLSIKNKKGTLTLDVTKDIILTNSSIIAYVQNPSNMAVLGVVSYDL